MPGNLNPGMPWDLVPSLSRPGGNITGVSLIAAELHGKCVELFRDMLPSVRRVAALGNAADPISKLFLEQVQLAGRTTGIEIAPAIMVSGPSEIDEAFAAMRKERADAVVVQGSLASKNTAELALKRGLPAATVPRSFAEVGGLMSYGADGPDAFRRAAAFVVNFAGWEAGGYAGRATHEIRAGYQPQHRKGARPR